MLSLRPDLPSFGGNSDLLKRLIDQQVRFLIVGGLAVKFHAPARHVDDLDILIDKSQDNAERFVRAMQGIGAVSAEEIVGSSKRLLSLKGFHYADIVTESDDFDFDAEWQRSLQGRVNGHAVRFASRELLIAMKSETGRERDVSDLALLTT